nr:unnamed protein product [Digitaria exilis]
MARSIFGPPSRTSSSTTNHDRSSATCRSRRWRPAHAREGTCPPSRSTQPPPQVPASPLSPAGTTACPR